MQAGVGLDNERSTRQGIGRDFGELEIRTRFPDVNGLALVQIDEFDDDTVSSRFEEAPLRNIEYDDQVSGFAGPCVGGGGGGAPRVPAGKAGPLLPWKRCSSAREGEGEPAMNRR